VALTPILWGLCLARDSGRRNIHCGNPILDSRSSDVLYAFMPELRNDVILNVAGSHWSVDPVTLYPRALRRRTGTLSHIRHIACEISLYCCCSFARDFGDW
jgi:hypothetical protein